MPLEIVGINLTLAINGKVYSEIFKLNPEIEFISKVMDFYPLQKTWVKV